MLLGSLVDGTGIGSRAIPHGRLRRRPFFLQQL